MNQEQHIHPSSGLNIFIVLFFLFSLNQGLFSNGNQIPDTIQRIARFDHTVNDSDYYYVRLFLFQSEFERLSFYKKAYDRGIYIADKHNFHDDSTLFRTTFDKEQALLEFHDLYQIAEAASLSTAETVKKEIVDSSPFYYSPGSQQSASLDAPSGSAIVCSQAEVACSENEYKFSSGTTGTAEPPVGGYPDYGCLSSQPCPAWFYMQVSVSGDIVIFISQVGLPPPFPPPPLDVDFICWGPFTSLTDGCATGLTGPNIVDCSFSPNATETCSIMNAQAGEIYILLITNYSQNPGTITFSQTGGSGVTDCNIVVNCSMIAITATPTVCDELTNTFSVSGNIEFSNPSPTGTLTITDSTAVPLISQTFTPPFTSPLPYTLTNIPCDGATHYLTAIFSDSLTCNLTQPVISPPTVCPHALISGGGVICDDGISETTVNIDINGSPGPYSFTYAINGLSQTPVINYSGPMPYPIITKIPGLYTMVSVSNLVCPVGGIVSGSANVILNPLPVPSFTMGENPVCLNIPGKIYMTEAGKLNYIWTIPPQATITAGGTATDNSVTLTWNTAGSYIISVAYTDPATLCTAASATPFTVTVNSLPVPSFIAGENSVCLNIPGKIYTTEAGKSNYIWTIPPQATITVGGTGTDNSVTLTWNTVGSFSISVNYTDPVTQCTAVNATPFPVTVLPTPDLTNTIRTDSICDSTFATMALSSNVAGTTFTWRAFASSPNLTGFGNQLTGTNMINQRIDNTGFSTQTVTYRLLPFANGCAGDSIDVVFTVFPKPDLSNTDRTDSICDSTFTSINLASNVSGTLFAWRAFGSSPLVTGYSNNTVPGIIINQRLENNGSVPQTVTYRLMPKANGCSGDSIDFVVTVFPTPDLSNPSLVKEICNNNNTNILLTSTVTGTLFTWTCTPGSVNITGYSNSVVPGSQINQNLINTGDIPETVTYNITPHANGCAGWVYNYVVTVIPSPYLTNSPLRNTQCNNQNTNLTLTSNVAGTQFNWTASASSPALTGYSNSVTPGTLIAQTLGNTGFNVDSVTYHVTPVTSGCPGSVTDYNVVVFPIPDVFFVPNGETVCEGVASGISNQSHVNGTTYSWTATASSPNLSGYSDSNGNMIVQTISNSGNTNESVTYQVIPQANGCPPGITQTVVLTIKPRPIITNTTTTFQICNNNSTSIFLQADVPGSTFAWRAFRSSPAVNGFLSGAGSSIIQTLTNSGFTIESVTYRVASTATGCTGDSTDFIVSVFPVPDVYFTPSSQTLCTGNVSNLLLQSNVSGSSFTWTATGSSLQVIGYSPGSGSVIQQTLDNLGSNIETVTYHVAPAANGCPGINNNVVVTVDPAPVVSFTLCIDPVTTTDAQPIKLKGGNPVNGTYSGLGVSGAILYPALAGVGTDTIFYSFTNTYGCSRNSYLVLSVIAPLPFTCGNILTDPRDNRQYPTIQLVSQCWMSSNLDYGQQVSSLLTQRDNCTVEKYCYDDIPGNCNSNGGLYQWDELMKFDNASACQGYCPPGWHIPTETEWNTLFGFFISNGFAGSPLKYDGFSGFTAFLYGASFKNASSDFNGFATLFWSSNSYGPNKAWAHGMNTYNPSVSYYPSARSNAFSVRCLKD